MTSTESEIPSTSVKMAGIGEGWLCAFISTFLTGVVLNVSGIAVSSCLGGQWCGMVDTALVGFKSTPRHAETQGLCQRACQAATWCGSANYELATGRCELVVNTSHDNTSDRLVRKLGWFYSYTETKVITDVPVSDPIEATQETRCTESRGHDFPILRTRETYPSADLSLARDGCARCGRQLCTLPQLKAAYDAGYRDDTWGLLESDGRDAKVTPCGTYYDRTGECYFIVQDNPSQSLIANTPRPDMFAHAYCCPTSCDLTENFPVTTAQGTYPSADLSLARDGCARCGRQLCTLPQLKAAYDAGYRDDTWGLLESDGRDARVAQCGDYYYNRPGECYYIVQGDPSRSLIPNTPRPNDFSQVFCCTTSCKVTEDKDWQLIFKGFRQLQDPHYTLHEMWTNSEWDDAIAESEGNFRNNSVYEAWNQQRIQTRCVKLSLLSVNHDQPLVQLIFDGSQSNITSWFDKGRLVSSPWNDLVHDTPTNYFSVDGDRPRGRRFFINKVYGECPNDVGWLLVTERGHTCPWEQPLAIMYSTTQQAVSWNDSLKADGSVGEADYMTIYISE